MLFTVVLCIIFCFPIAWLIVRDRLRAAARTQADQIISGSIPASAEQLNKIISRLLPAYSSTARTETDRVRVRRLRDIRNEMQKPHD